MGPDLGSKTPIFACFFAVFDAFSPHPPPIYADRGSEPLKPPPFPYICRSGPDLPQKRPKNGLKSAVLGGFEPHPPPIYAFWPDFGLFSAVFRALNPSSPTIYADSGQNWSIFGYFSIFWTPDPPLICEIDGFSCFFLIFLCF